MSSRIRSILAVAVLGLLVLGFLFIKSSGEIAAAQGALDDWGRFAGSGDLRAVADSFADGPQLAQLRTETVDPDEAYTFELFNPVVIRPGVIVGDVMVGRPGEPTQTYRWEIEMRLDSGEWKLWTVRSAP